MDRTEPAEPIDKIEPDEPMDKIEPDEPIDKIEPDEPMDRIEPGAAAASSAEPLLIAIRPLCRNGYRTDRAFRAGQAAPGLRAGVAAVNASGRPVVGGAWANSLRGTRENRAHSTVRSVQRGLEDERDRSKFTGPGRR
jgi:hypothetical protein